ncbi:MAG: DUF2652 domain-containing protein [Chloroflexota bacterium]
MAATPQSGFLLLADLTGYTAYLARGEIEHAPTIAGDLLETVVGRLEPPLRLAKFEGDAAFMWMEDGRAEGSLLLDAVEAAYIAFRRRLRSIEQATSCDCNACSQAPRLDLKFFLHHGTYVRTTIAGRDELAGSSVIVVHRLLKGVAAEAARGPDGRASGFVVLTETALDAVGMSGDALEATAGSESIEHLGELVTFTIDLESRWLTEAGRQRVDLDGDGRGVELATSITAPPAVVWAYLTSPKLRPTWEGPVVISEMAADGRRGIGTMSQCVTGRLATLEEIVDWQPFEHVGYRLSVPEVGPVDAAFDLVSTGATTELRLRWVPIGQGALDSTSAERIRAEKEAALVRLGRVAARNADRTLLEGEAAPAAVSG